MTWPRDGRTMTCGTDSTVAAGNAVSVTSHRVVDCGACGHFSHQVVDKYLNVLNSLREATHVNYKHIGAHNLS